MFKKFLNSEIEILPWKGKVTIFEFVKEQVDTHKKIIDETLPDEEELFKGEKIRFISGARDSLFGGLLTKNNQHKIINNLLKLVRQQAKYQNNKTRRATYVKVMNDSLIDFIDPFLEVLRQQEDIDLNNLYEEALWFIKNSAHRGAVKFGIALLGIFNCERDKDVLITICKHEEFTLFTAVAIKNGTRQPNDNLFLLAKSVQGWGKISIVERLEPSSQEIKDWLIEYGCENSIMNEYLAYTCAIKGELHKVLIQKEISHEKYKGSGKIISALICGGPAENIDDYKHANIVIKHFLLHSINHCRTIVDFVTIIEIGDFIDEEDGIWEERYKNGWSPQQRIDIRNMVDKIKNEDTWIEVILEELHNSSNNLYIPLRAARSLNIDVWPILYEKLEQNPTEDSLYFELMRTADRSRVEQLVSFAEINLPFEQICTGPALEMGLGIEFKIHHCLDFIIQDLDRFEGVGLPLIEKSLNSPVIRNRNMALNVLESWPVKHWRNSKCIKILMELNKIEPDEEIRERVGLLLKKI